MTVFATNLWRGFSPVYVSAIGRVAYHTSNIFMSEKNPALRKLKTLSAKSKLQHKSAVGNKSSTQRELEDTWQNERQTLKPSNKRATVLSELQKLTLDDEHRAAKRGGTAKQKPSTAAKHNYEFVFGISPCLLALTHGRREAYGLYVKHGDTSLRTSVLQVCEEAHRRGVPIHHVGKRDIDKMAPGRVHQGVCLQASPLTYVKEEKQEHALSAKQNIPPLWLVIESVQDPMNLGAILRSAYFLGIDRVVSSISHSCPLSPVVSKASSGTMEVMDVYGYGNLGEMLKVKKAQGWDVVGTVGSESEESHITRCSDFVMAKPTLLLIGGEGEGLSLELKNHCQTLLTIPAGRQLLTGIESLNVSVATGILLHALLFSRCSHKQKW